MLRESNSRDDARPPIGTAAGLAVPVFRKVTPRQAVPRSLPREKFRHNNALRINVSFYCKFVNRVSPIVLYKLSCPHGAETSV